ncbi:hypothetical protein EHV15_19455 [Paenibacillus oralis]|uniref:B3/B4 tRNA-binding domain-containing protein n=1 Tax=Paenibacillus oralis TaxID=2490856 RepID=A0A3P3U8R1_9BACL|nr:phenylalanine--tRNA ligase beta subunit-related protein [Paenibacillus oralis]RRJ64853.1 hypothetical protein EHV15_19455 [Paenibacillus oralis]
MKFIVQPEVFQVLNDVCFAVVSASGIDNTQKLPEIEELLQIRIMCCESDFENKEVKKSEEISCYRDAFRAMEVNPNKYMCSIEALLTRISKRKGLPSINPLVDLGNAISLKYKVPIGAHDLNSSNEDFYVRHSQVGDIFIPFGETAGERMDIGEIVYATGHSVRTRRWIWRQSELGKITSGTNSVIFPIDGFEHANKDQLLSAQDELATLLKRYFNCKVQTGWVDSDNRIFNVSS